LLGKRLSPAKQRKNTADENEDDNDDDPSLILSFHKTILKGRVQRNKIYSDVSLKSHKYFLDLKQVKI